MSNVYRIFRSGAGFATDEELVSEANGQLKIRVAVDGDNSGRLGDTPEGALIRFATAPDDLELVDASGTRKPLGDLRKSARGYYQDGRTDGIAIALPGFWPNRQVGSGLFPLGVEEAARAWIKLAWDKLVASGEEWQEAPTKLDIEFVSMSPREKSRALLFLLHFNSHTWETSILVHRNDLAEWVPAPESEIIFVTPAGTPMYNFRWQGNRYFAMTAHKAGGIASNDVQESRETDQLYRKMNFQP